MRRLNKDGFTIVELLLAMAFFSFIMLFVISGFVQINRTYTRGITQKNVQNAARRVLDDVTDNIRNAQAGDVDVQYADDQNNFRVCIGAIRYGYNRQIGADSTTANITSEVLQGSSDAITIARNNNPAANCNDPIPQSAAETQTLIDDSLLVQHFDVNQIGTSDSFQIQLVISTDTLTDFDEYGQTAVCSVNTGDEFCYVVSLETVVTARN